MSKRVTSYEFIERCKALAASPDREDTYHNILISDGALAGVGEYILDLENALIESEEENPLDPF